MGRMKSEVKMISLIKKEDSESAKAVTNLDTEAQLKSHQSMDLFFPKIIKSLFKEINEMNLLKSETNEGRNTQVLTKNENINESISTKALIDNGIILSFILFCTI